MTNLSTASVLLLLMLGSVQSQPPTLGGRKQGNPPQQQPQPAQRQTEDLRGTEQSPAVVRILPKSQEETRQEQAERKQRATAERWTIALGALTVAVMIGQLVVYKIQANRLSDTIRKMDEIAASQTKDMRDSIAEATRAAAAMEIAAEASKASADAAKDNAIAARETATTLNATLKTSREIERGYITISHVTPPPSYVILDFDEPGAVWFEVEIRNHGRTPADVLGGVLTVEIGPANSMPPEKIPTGRFARIPPAFLVANNAVRFRTMVHGFTEDQIKGVRERYDIETRKPSELWLAGYVDYRDRFSDVVHRGGYGRHFRADNGDLVFDQTTETLNYDRPIQPGDDVDSGRPS